jgi:4-amino-4-deoxy-L-arabinose transferase-like glycosyltransferase
VQGARFAKLIRAAGLEGAAAVAAAAIAAAAILIATAPHGPRVSTDSVFYLSASDSLRAGQRLVVYDGSPLTQVAPGFPVAIAVVGEVAGGGLLGARIVNSLCLGFIVLAGWVLLRRHVGSRASRLAGVAGLASAPTLFVISSAAWSEPLFIAVVLATALAVEMVLERPGARRWVIVAGLVAGCSVAVRYSGIWLIATAAFVFLAANRRASTLRVRVQRTALFLLVASIVPALVVQRNLRLTKHPFAIYGKSATSVAQNLSAAADEITGWLVPGAAASAVRAVLLAALIAGFGMSIVSWTRRARSPGRTSDGGRSTVGQRRVPLWPLGLLASGYVVFLVIAASTENLDPVGPRLLSPAFVPAVVLALAGLDRLLASSVSRGALIAVGAGVVVMWLAAQLDVTRMDFNYLRHNGSGFTDRPWRGSELVSLVRRRGTPPTFTNFPEALFFLTSIRSRCWPSLTPTVCGRSAPDLTRGGAGGPAYLAWFTASGRTHPFVPPALVGRLQLIEVASVPDGRLYRVRARQPGG